MWPISREGVVKLHRVGEVLHLRLPRYYMQLVVTRHNDEMDCSSDHTDPYRLGF